MIRTPCFICGEWFWQPLEPDEPYYGCCSHSLCRWTFGSRAWEKNEIAIEACGGVPYPDLKAAKRLVEEPAW